MVPKNRVGRQRNKPKKRRDPRPQCMTASLSEARRRGRIAIGSSSSSSSQYESAPCQSHRPNLGTALQQKAVHHHEYAQAELRVVTKERQAMQLQVEKLQADMERNEKIVSEAPLRHAEEAASAVLRDLETHTSATEPIERLIHHHQNNVGEESSESRSCVAAARSTLKQWREAVRVAVLAQKEREEQEPETHHLERDAELSLRVANGEARISALEQEERTGVGPGGCGNC